MNILGISALYHDAAAALVQDGEVVAAAQEERFTRIKHDPSFPTCAIAYCLQAGRVGGQELDAVVFYEKPLTKLIRIVRTYAAVSPRGRRTFRDAVAVWTREKLWIPYRIERELTALGYGVPKDLLFAEHHQSHGASAFFPSPFTSAAVLTMDAVGESATASIGWGRGNTIELLRELHFPHSLGMLYSAFTFFCGFRVNSGEYKLMGLAPYGEPVYVEKILEQLVDLRPDGSLRLNLEYFDFVAGTTMTNRRFSRLFGGMPREPETEITRREVDIAASIQAVTEEAVLRMARTAAALTGERNLCLAGGVALNSVANGRLLRESSFERIWIQPAAGDAGGSLGAALFTWYQTLGNERRPPGRDGMRGSYLGPQFSCDEVRAYLDANGYPFDAVSDPHEWADRIATLLAEGKIVGILMGRMEFGPRALGHRSILADPRSPTMQALLNSKVKMREGFRPFAPAVLAERASEIYDIEVESPYMLYVAPIRPDQRLEVASLSSDSLLDQLAQVRSAVPAVTHVDYSARLQTVHRSDSPRFHSILKAFDRITGCPVLVNTSFNVRGEPLVCTPEDAYTTFMRTDIDYLVLEDCLLAKQDQIPRADDWTAAQLVLD